MIRIALPGISVSDHPDSEKREASFGGLVMEDGVTPIDTETNEQIGLE